MGHPISSSSAAPNRYRPPREPLPLDVRRQLWARFWDILLSRAPADPPSNDQTPPTHEADQDRRS